MKRILTASLVGILTCLVLITSMFTVFADTAKATVNGKEAAVGSKIEYTLFLESYKQDVVGIQMIFKFDPAKLALKDVNLESFPGATLNANKDGDGMIYFNNSDINGIDFSKSREIAKLNFDVIAEGDSTIEYLIQYLYDIDLVNIYDYTLTYTLTVDGTDVITTEAPVLADANKVANGVSGDFDKGDFENNQEGTGSGIKPTVPKAPASSQNQNKGSNNTAIFVIGGIVVVALVAVIVLLVSKNRKDK